MIEILSEEVPSRWAQILRLSSRHLERVVMLEKGEPVAALVPISDLQLLEEYDDRTDVLDALVDKIKQVKDGVISVGDDDDLPTIIRATHASSSEGQPDDDLDETLKT